MTVSELRARMLPAESVKWRAFYRVENQRNKDSK